MVGLRSALRVLVLGALLSQGTSVLVAAAVLGAGGGVPEMVCVCDHAEDHGQCPMHHPDRQPGRCRMKSAEVDPAVAFLSLLPTWGVPVQAARTIATPERPSRLRHSDPATLDLALPPHLRPPRT